VCILFLHWTFLDIPTETSMMISIPHKGRVTMIGLCGRANVDDRGEPCSALPEVITTAPTEANLRTSELDISASSLKYNTRLFSLLSPSEVLIADVLPANSMDSLIEPRYHTSKSFTPHCSTIMLCFILRTEQKLTRHPFPRSDTILR